MGYQYPQDPIYTNPSRKPSFPPDNQTDNMHQARRSNIPREHKNYSNVIQNHALKDRQCPVSSNVDNKPITILIDTGTSISLHQHHHYNPYSLSSTPPLQPMPFSVSGEDGKPLIVLDKTFLSIAIDDNTFRVQLVVIRNILFPVVLGIDFLQTHGGIISFPTNHLYLTNPPPKSTEPPIHTNHKHHPHILPTHTPNTYHPYTATSPQPNQPYHIISNQSLTIPPRANTIMTIPCALPRSGNYLFKPSAQHFVEQPAHYIPVKINAENGNLPVHFINHSDQEVVIPKHSYVGVMEKI